MFMVISMRYGHLNGWDFIIYINLQNEWYLFDTEFLHSIKYNIFKDIAHGGGEGGGVDVVVLSSVLTLNTYFK